MKNLIHIWPTVADLADDLGLPYQTVHSWTARGIPAKRYAEIITAARRKGHALSFEDLAGPLDNEDAA
ncbi:hypothetical protein [Pseudotabrizicola algicola]|uniref:CI repressor n=1 Tax=Pseudotabrizicola algicola TaxID=2709381 RepID=A0A6B3RLR2_9RHOB|nr:hypothetical protein [Pseudotabrizicola algicola]NEX45205.1 hypothetical protein [Pseudotabrizicola algicola]